jgi:hypothetical protein
MTVVSSANYTVSDTEFFLGEGGGSFMCIMSNRGPKIDAWGILCFNVPESEKIFWVVLGDLTSSFYLLLVK